MDFSLSHILHTGGRIFVIGIYLGLLVSLVTTFFAFNIYMNESAILGQDSPFFDVELVGWQKKTIFDNYTRSYLWICFVAIFSVYICV